MLTRVFHFMAGLASFFVLSSADAAELVMVEQPGCGYCELWDRQISAIYPMTDAGRHAPLRRVQLRAKPDDLTYARPVMFTPTFLVVEDGQELARLEGYPGEDFFWWHIETLLAKETGLVIKRGD